LTTPLRIRSSLARYRKVDISRRYVTAVSQDEVYKPTVILRLDGRTATDVN